MPQDNKGIEIVKSSKAKRALISNHGIEIHRRGEPISSMTSTDGYVYLVMDCSGSMEGNKLQQAKKGAIGFAQDAISKGYLTGLIQFHSFSKLVCEPSRDLKVLRAKLERLEIGDLTYMADAIQLAHKQLKRRIGALVMVIVTDGMPNGTDDPQASLKAGKSAKHDGIEIIAIGTDDADNEFLKQLASRNDLGIKVSSKQLEKTITDAARMLPSGRMKAGEK